MPYICMANYANQFTLSATKEIPAGVLQITDLAPNVSQDNNPTNGPGQTRYLRTDGFQLALPDPQTGLIGAGPDNRAAYRGLAAYLVDRVEPGAGDVAEATLTLNGVLATDRVTVKGVFFEFAAGANDLVRAGTAGDPFIVGLGADDNAAAANLTLALNDAANVHVVMDALATLNVHTLATNVGAPSAVVLIQPEDGVGLVTGVTGDLAVTVSNSTRLQLDAATSTLGRLSRAFEKWDAAAVQAAWFAIQNAVDTGAALTAAAVDALLGAAVSADLGGGTIATSNSTGTLTELLQVLAGRSYSLPKGSLKFTAVTAPDEIHAWDATQRGSFTTPNVVFDSQMINGVWAPTGPWLKTGGSNSKPTFTGGDTVNNDIAGARSTYDTTAFQASVQNGQLAQYANGVTLFPDADVQAKVAPFLRSKQTRYSEQTGLRLVTVYDDDGTVLV